MPDRLPFLKRAQDHQRQSEKSLVLPPIASEADDLKAIKKAVEDAAAVSGALWISYLFVLFYLALAAGAVTHVDLLLERPIDLPFLNNIKLPLLAFFILAPLLFLISHAYTMAHFVMLSDKAKRFHKLLREQIKSGDSHSAQEAQAHGIRTGLRRQLPSNIFVQFLAGPDDFREGAFGLLLKSIAWMTLAILPVALLVLVQLQFLPYHDWRITWLHRFTVLADLGLVWWLWVEILAARDAETKQLHSRFSLAAFNPFQRRATDFRMSNVRSAALMSGAVSGLAIYFSWIVATFPGEWKRYPYAWFAIIEPKAATNFIFGEVRAMDGLTTGSWPLNTLRLPEFNLYDALDMDHEKLDKKEHSISLRERHLEYADFLAADFGKGADFRWADLEGAYLVGAKLTGAMLSFADLTGASLAVAKLQGAHLNLATIQVASLASAHLEGAFLSGAHLEGSQLRYADLQGALLSTAHLQAASLENANLKGAILHFSELHGASLDNAQLEGASLDSTQLQGTSLVDVTFRAASLQSPYFWRANFGEKFSGKEHAPMQLNNPDWSSAQMDGSLWSRASYTDLKALIEGFPEGRVRTEALSRIACLAYSNTDEKCRYAQSPAAVANWQGELNKARGPDREKAVGDILHDLICVRDVNAIFILRGLLRDSYRGLSQIAAAGEGALELIQLILNGNQNGECPVSAQLTFEDKLQLSKQKEELEKQKRKKLDEVMLQRSTAPKIPPEPEISPPPVDELFGDRSRKTGTRKVAPF